MSIIRIRFEKKDDIKFISHLDMMNSFQRAVRRAGLEAEYSHGFNPQMHMVFGAPLSLGFSSEAEYADLFFTRDYEAGHVMQKLNETMPEGLPVRGAGIYTGKINIMADISFAEYSFRYNGTLPADKVAELVSEENFLMVEKVRKGRSKTVDIRPLILKISAEGDRVGILVKAGNNQNLNPMLLVEAVKKNMDLEAGGDLYKRTAQYVQRNGEMYNPLDEMILSEGEGDSI